MKKNHNEPKHEGYSQEPSEYKAYGDYSILDSPQGSNLQFPDEDDDEESYLPFIDFADDQDFEE